MYPKPARVPQRRSPASPQSIRQSTFRSLVNTPVHSLACTSVLSEHTPALPVYTVWPVHRPYQSIQSGQYADPTSLFSLASTPILLVYTLPSTPALPVYSLASSPALPVYSLASSPALPVYTIWPVRRSYQSIQYGQYAGPTSLYSLASTPVLPAYSLASTPALPVYTIWPVRRSCQFGLNLLPVYRLASKPVCLPALCLLSAHLRPGGGGAPSARLAA